MQLFGVAKYLIITEEAHQFFLKLMQVDKKICRTNATFYVSLSDYY